MTNLYRHKDWVDYRLKVIKLHNGRCDRCQRSATHDGVILQVHHKLYINGRKPWEYPLNDCEALCKGCHAQEHGVIMPQSGWELVASDDLGEVCGSCELCDTNLRYVFAIQHLNWGAMAVGTDCCDKLTMTTEASEYHNEYLKYVKRLKTFVESNKWKLNRHGFLSIRRAKIPAYIIPTNDKFRIGIDEFDGKALYETELDARIKIFEFIESGEAQKYLDMRALKELKSKHPDHSDYLQAPQNQ